MNYNNGGMGGPQGQRPMQGQNGSYRPGQQGGGYTRQAPIRPGGGYTNAPPIRPGGGYNGPSPAQNGGGYNSRPPVQGGGGYNGRPPVRGGGGYNGPGYNGGGGMGGSRQKKGSGSNKILIIAAAIMGGAAVIAVAALLIFMNLPTELIVNGGSGSGKFKKGQNVSIAADQKDGQSFVRWVEAGDNDDLTPEQEVQSILMFTMPRHKVELTAQFETQQYNLTVDNASGSGTYVYDGMVTLTADGSGTFREWDVEAGFITIEDGDLSTPTITFKMPAQDVHISAVYETEAAVTIDPNEEGNTQQTQNRPANTWNPITASTSLIYTKTLYQGQYVYFGTFEQDNNYNNGEEPIVWRVLWVNPGQDALLLSEYALDGRPYLSPRNYTTWANSHLRSWLNNDFYDSAFTSAEKARIISCVSADSGNPNFPSSDGGSDIKDYIFCLSYNDVTDSRFFAGDADRLCTPTPYAASRIDESKQNGYCYWWLRSPGRDNSTTVDIRLEGEIGYKGDYNSNNEGVRPAVLVSLK